MSKLTETDREIILNHFRRNYEAMSEFCGNESEEAREARVLYKKVFSRPLEECRPEIEDFYTEMYEAVDGRIHEYYSSDPELFKMIVKILEVKTMQQKIKECDVFQSVENETTYNNGRALYTISAICDDDGSFEICIDGVGGTETANTALKRVEEIIHTKVCN